ncbi:hypothetical protein ACPZ19_21990 [Amycolatopsis lurida]
MTTRTSTKWSPTPPRVSRLRIAAGNDRGVCYQLAQPLAGAWAAGLAIERPEIQQTRGSPDNLARLRAGTADVAFSAADVATDPSGEPNLAALARIYDDYLFLFEVSKATFVTSAAPVSAQAS